MQKIIFSTLLVLILIGANASYGQSIERDQVKESAIVEELRSRSPRSVEAFKLGTEAMDNGDAATAKAEFEKVIKDVPDFDPALRRLGGMEIELGNYEFGLAQIEKALSIRRSEGTLLTLAQAVLRGPNVNDRAFSDPSRALSLAKEANAIEASLDSYVIMAEASLQLERMADYDKAVAGLRTKFPDTAAKFYFNGLDLANKGQYADAITELRAGEEFGLDPTVIAELEALIREAQIEASPFGKYSLYAYIFFALVGIWILGMLVLYILGKVYSVKTLKAIETLDPNDELITQTTSLRDNYRRLISFAGFYYYLSQPILAIVVVGTVAIVTFLSFWAGRIPIGIILGMAFVGVMSIYFMFKTLISRPVIEDPGRELNREDAPGLWQLSEQVADALGTRRLDEIRLTPGAELAVYEKGTYREKLNDEGRRVLIVGAAVLNDFRTNAFRAVLAHEYGHLSNRDTAGGDIAYNVNSDLLRFADAIVASGNNTYHNLAFHFLRVYHFIFRRLTHGASRLQEILADRFAVRLYGAEAFEEGLKHVIRREVEFNKLVNPELERSISRNVPLVNVYDLKIESETDKTAVDSEAQEIINAKTTDDDTHPAPADRFRFANRVTAEKSEPIDGEVWDLINEREKLTAEMSEMLQANVTAAYYGT